jgi:hypothetical protein
MNDYWHKARRLSILFCFLAASFAVNGCTQRDNKPNDSGLIKLDGEGGPLHASDGLERGADNGPVPMTILVDRDGTHLVRSLNDSTTPMNAAAPAMLIHHWRSGPSRGVFPSQQTTRAGTTGWIRRVRIWTDGERVIGLQLTHVDGNGEHEEPIAGSPQGRLDDFLLEPSETVVKLDVLMEGEQLRAMRFGCVGVSRGTIPGKPDWNLKSRPRVFTTSAWTRGKEPTLTFQALHGIDTGYPFEEIVGFTIVRNIARHGFNGLGVYWQQTPEIRSNLGASTWPKGETDLVGAAGYPSKYTGRAASSGIDPSVKKITFWKEPNNSRINGIEVVGHEGSPMMLGHRSGTAVTHNLSRNHAIDLVVGDIDFSTGYLKKLDLRAVPVMRPDSTDRPGRLTINAQTGTILPLTEEFRFETGIGGAINEPISEFYGFHASWDDRGIRSFGVIRRSTSAYSFIVK